MPSISVIMPVYNKEEFLDECIESILAQTIRDIEIIAINDGSTDASLDILHKYTNRDRRIVLIDHENKGVAYSRNCGVDKASGKYICFMDPDDWYPEADILEDLYKTAEANHVNICGGSFSSWRNNKIVTQYYEENLDYTFHKDGIVQYSNYQFDYGFHRFIYNLQMLKENNIRFPLYERYQDPPFLAQAMVCAERFYALKRVVYRYRESYREINWTNKKTNDMMRGILDNLELSRKLQYGKLHYINYFRINKPYFCQIISGALKQGNEELLYLLSRINTTIDRDLLIEHGYQIDHTWLINPLKELLREMPESADVGSVVEKAGIIRKIINRLRAK